MRHKTRQSIHQSLAILSLLTLSLVLAGAGCSDSGSSTGPTVGGPNGTPDSVSFADDVRPIFLSNCSGSSCHVNASQPALGLILSNYQGVIDGSNSRAIVIAGNAQDSEIIKRLEGRSRPSMPLDRALLPEATVKIVRDWIDQGANEN